MCRGRPEQLALPPRFVITRSGSGLRGQRHRPGCPPVKRFDSTSGWCSCCAHLAPHCRHAKHSKGSEHPHHHREHLQNLRKRFQPVVLRSTFSLPRVDRGLPPNQRQLCPRPIHQSHHGQQATINQSDQKSHIVIAIVSSRIKTYREDSLGRPFGFKLAGMLAAPHAVHWSWTVGRIAQGG